jgi:SET domain
MQSMTGNSMYAFRDVPGKGKGLVAIEKISKGTRILSEEPTLTVPRDEPDSERLRTSICQQVDALSEYQRQAFLSMHNIHAYGNVAEQYLGIVRTNGLPIETDGIGGGIFLEACRINHACDNNAQKNWNKNIKRHTVHALRDIYEGEEITIYYLSIHKNRKARREALQAKFGFTCSCRLCSLPPEQSQENDKRLDEIYRLDSLIGRGGIEGILSSPSRTLRYVDQQVQLYNEQGPDDAGLPRAFLDAAQIAIANGDLARGRIFVERAVFGWRTAGGSDRAEVIEYGALAQDPSKHELYGISMKWRTTVDEVPCGLEPGDFEDWLWKREKPQRPGQLVDLRNRATFPGFIDLPGENVVDLDFYESSDMVTYRPRRHWCFLAEIVDFATLLRLQMEINDIDGRKVPLFFYTDGRGSELAPAKVQRGYTVAILYAQRHAFMFDEPGIRHEDPRMIKVSTLASPSD